MHQVDPCMNPTIEQNRGLHVLVAITFANRFFNNSIDCACDWPSDPYLNSNDFIDVIADEATSDIVVIAGQLCLICNCVGGCNGGSGGPKVQVMMKCAAT